MLLEGLCVWFYFVCACVHSCMYTWLCMCALVLSAGTGCWQNNLGSTQWTGASTPPWLMDRGQGGRGLSCPPKDDFIWDRGSAAKGCFNGREFRFLVKIHDCPLQECGQAELCVCILMIYAYNYDICCYSEEHVCATLCLSQ